MGGISNTGWMRNYGAMGDPKLRGALEDFQRGYGDAINRVEGKGGSIEDNRAKCEYEARKRGMLEGDGTVVVDTKAITEPQFCPECERKKAFYLDDYICRDCRTKLDGPEENPYDTTAPTPVVNDSAHADAAAAELARSLGNL